MPVEGRPDGRGNLMTGKGKDAEHRNRKVSKARGEAFRMVRQKKR